MSSNALLDVTLDFPLSRFLSQRTGVSLRSRWLISGWLMSTVSSHYGDPSDYDEWARLGGEGAESWAYKDFRKYVGPISLYEIDAESLTI